MNVAAQLRILQQAQGDPARLALATVDLVYPELSEAERASLHEALEAAAIAHWCDVGVLASVLGISLDDSIARLTRLRGLSLIEPFPARGAGAVNVHESARLALRKAMAVAEQERFRRLSNNAAAHFAADTSPAGRIEWISHLLCGDPQRGADALEWLDRNWSSGRPEERHALTKALDEIEAAGLVAGAARVEVLLAIAKFQSSRGLTDLEGSVREALHLARSVGRPSAEGRANGLLGHVLNLQGEKLAEVQDAYDEYLRIMQQLVEQDSSCTDWQWELAEAHSRKGDVLQAQGQLAEAQASFGEYLEIMRRLVQQDPSNAGWQQDLAVAYSRIGGVLEARGELVEAQTVLGETLAIIRRLAEQDPSNANWQRDLAVAHSRIGLLLEAQGHLSEAHSAFVEDFVISRRLVEQDPTNPTWQRDLAVTHSRIAGCLEARGKLDDAQRAFGEAFEILRRLTEQDPNNAGWQLDLAALHSRVGHLLQTQGRLAEARVCLEADLRISRRLVEQDPSNAGWQQGLAMACRCMADLHQRQGENDVAFGLYEEARGILSKLTENAPDVARWARDKESLELASRRRSMEGLKIKTGGKTFVLLPTGDVADNDTDKLVGKWRSDSTGSEAKNRLRYQVDGAEQPALPVKYSFNEFNQLVAMIPGAGEGGADGEPHVFRGLIRIDDCHDVVYEILTQSGAPANHRITVYGDISFTEKTNDLLVELAGGGLAVIRGEKGTSGISIMKAEKNFIAEFKADDLLRFTASTKNDFSGAPARVAKRAQIEFVGKWDLREVQGENQLVFLSKVISADGENTVTLGFAGKVQAVSFGFAYYADKDGHNFAFNIKGEHQWNAAEARWELSLGHSAKKFKAEFAGAITRKGKYGVFALTGAAQIEHESGKKATLALQIEGNYSFENNKIVFKVDVQTDQGRLVYDLLLEGKFVFKNGTLSFQAKSNNRKPNPDFAIGVTLKSDGDQLKTDLSVVLEQSKSQVRLTFEFELQLRWKDGVLLKEPAKALLA